MRSAYAEAQTLVLTATKDKETSGKATVSMTNGKATSVVVTDVAIKSQKDNNWSDEATELPFNGHIPADPGTAGNYTMTFTYTTDGEISDVGLAPSK